MKQGLFKIPIGIALLCSVLLSAVTAVADQELNAAVASYENGEFEAALKVLERLADADPDDSEILFHLGRTWLKLNKHDKSIAILKKAIKLNDAVGKYYHSLGHAYVAKLEASSFIKKKGIANDVKRSFMLAVEKDPEDVEARESLAHFYFEAPGFAGGDKEEALNHIAEIERRDAIKAHWVRAMFLLKQDDLDGVTTEYKTLAAKEPENPQPLFMLGRVYQDREMFADAFTVFESIVNNDKYSEDNIYFMNAMYQIGRTAVFSRDNLARGEECLKLFLAMPESDEAPSHCAAQWRLGMIYEFHELNDQARDAYEMAIQLDGDFKDAEKSLKKLKKKIFKEKRR